MSDAVQNFDYHQGNSIPWRITVRNKAGVIVPLSTALEIRCAVSNNARDLAPLFTKSLTGGGSFFETDGDDGVILVFPAPAETASLADQYHYEVDADFGGATLETILSGTAKILPSVLN